MGINMLEGDCIGLDAHLSDLLRAYTQEHNVWLGKMPNNDNCTCPPTPICHEEMARYILGRFLQDWAMEKRKARQCQP